MIERPIKRMVDISDVYVYRDGGSIVIRTNRGVFWYDPKDGLIYREDVIGSGKKKLVTDNLEYGAVIRSLSQLAARYFYIKRTCDI